MGLRRVRDRCLRAPHPRLAVLDVNDDPPGAGRDRTSDLDQATGRGHGPNRSGPPQRPGQYTSVRFTETVALEGLTASIGKVGDAYDNAAAETVMGLPDVEEVTFDW